MATNADISNRLVRDLVRDFDLPEEAAIGVVGNLAYESGGFNTLQEKKPVVPGSRGGYGYAQWTGPRRKAFEKYAADNNLDINSYEANYGYLKQELSSKEYKPLLKVLRDTTNIPFATQKFSAQFLRPGFKNYEQRDVYAEQVANNFRVATETSTTPPPVPMPRGARPQPPSPISGQPIAPVGITPRLSASGMPTYTGTEFNNPFGQNDYARMADSTFGRSSITPAGSPYSLQALQQRPILPYSLPNMPSSWYAGVPAPAAPVQNMVRPGVPAGFPAAPQNMVRPGAPAGFPAAPQNAVRPGVPAGFPAAPARQTSTMTPTAPVYQRPTGFNPYNFGGVNDVTNSYGRFVSGQPSGAIRNVQTQTVRRDGTTVMSPQAGSVAMPRNVRPNVAPIAPKPTSYGAGLSFPSGVGVPPKPTATPLTGFGGMTGTYKSPTVNPLTGFGGMTGTYTPPKTAPIPQTRPTTTSAGVKTSSSGGSSSQAAAPATFKGSSTGRVYTVGQTYTTSTGGKVVAQADGTFKKV